jgi:RNA-directed DNA polymerase
VSREVHAPFCERVGVQFPRATLLIITGHSKEWLENEVKPVVMEFLAERGLVLSPEKTRITHIKDGFDFLGWKIRKYDGKFLMKPSKANVKAHLDKIREVIKANKTANLTVSLIGNLW